MCTALQPNLVTEVTVTPGWVAYRPLYGDTLMPLWSLMGQNLLVQSNYFVFSCSVSAWTEKTREVFFCNRAAEKQRDQSWVVFHWSNEAGGTKNPAEAISWRLSSRKSVKIWAGLYFVFSFRRGIWAPDNRPRYAYLMIFRSWKVQKLIKWQIWNSRVVSTNVIVVLQHQFRSV